MKTLQKTTVGLLIIATALLVPDRQTMLTDPSPLVGIIAKSELEFETIRFSL